MKIKTHRSNAGFTLLELLVVLAILAMLAGLVGPRVMDQFGKGKQDAAIAQIGNLKSSLELYKLDAGNYPQSLEALTKGTSGGKPVLSKLPKDPWGNAYQYRFPGEHDDYDIVSYGSDKAPGGEGEARDINSWD